MSDHEHSMNLVLAFDTDAPEFARGVEVGLTYARVCQSRRDESLEFTVHANNAEMIIRLPRRSDVPSGRWKRRTAGCSLCSGRPLPTKERANERVKTVGVSCPRRSCDGVPRGQWAPPSVRSLVA